MNIRPISSYSCSQVNNRIAPEGEKQPSFGHVEVTPECMTKIKALVSPEIIAELEKIMKKPINLMEALHYNEMPPNLKANTWNVLKRIPENERNDLTVTITDISREKYSFGTLVDEDLCSEEVADLNDGTPIISDNISLKLEAPAFVILKGQKGVLFQTEGNLSGRSLKEHGFISEELPIPSYEFIIRRIQDQYKGFLDFLASRVGR
ncbi:hypothetical protein J6S88_05175 [bacterium]|nr:hypothetical protein [bacterium]